MGVGHTSPNPFQEVTTFGRNLARPARFQIGGAKPVGDLGDSLALAVLVEVRPERIVGRERFDDGGIIFARGIAHQRAHSPRMVDQYLQVLTAALAFRRIEDETFEPCLLEIIVKRGIVLEIDLRAAAADLVERRLGNEEVPVLDQLRHLPVKEGQQQGTDVRAVDVGVGHDHDLVIAQLLEVEFLVADRSAQSLDQRADLLRAEHSIEPRALDVEDLALQGKDRLIVAVAPLLGGAAGAVALDQK